MLSPRFYFFYNGHLPECAFFSFFPCGRRIRIDFFLFLLLLFLCLLLLVTHLEAQIFIGNALELLIVVVLQNLQGELVNLVGAVQNLVALLLEEIHLRHFGNLFVGFAGCVVDVLLVVPHAAHVFLEGGKLVGSAAVEFDKVLQLILMYAILIVDTVLQLHAEGFEQFVVALPIFLLHLQKGA